MMSATFKGTLCAVQAKAAQWKQTHPTARIVSDCAPMATTNVTAGPQPPYNEPVWVGTIHYEELASN